ncbi:hypothetical protein L6452_05387 [Arctium lappa]|uniref:Uncharacterized protein n=1 Tax=Arctium lappa TaxID=4217 RepID=A0ACB9EFZ9_ARCLA|nr:hypothetical protein L6452_05387 [Arctium lappa]
MFLEFLCQDAVYKRSPCSPPPITEERDPSTAISKNVGASVVELSFRSPQSKEEKSTTQVEGIGGPTKREHSGLVDGTKGEAHKDKGKSVMIAEQEAEEAQKKKETAKYG